jgi:hypothetical protein
MDLSLHLFVVKTSRLDSLHVIGVNVRMLSLDMLLLSNLVIIEINNQLKKLVLAGISFDRSLDSSATSRSLSYRLLVMLLLEVGDHLLLWWLKKGNDAKVWILATKVGAHDP